MSAKYSYLEVAVSVIDAEGLYANYHTNGTKLAPLPGIDNLAAHFMELGDGYMMWQPSETLRAFSYYMFTPDGSNRLQMSATVIMPREVLVPGRTILNLLGSIKNRIKDGEELTEDMFDQMIEHAGFTEEPLCSPDASVSMTQDSTLCFRTYATSVELANIFGFPRQKDYGGFGAVAVVPASVLTTAEMELPQVTTAVDKSLMVVCPENVSTSSMQVSYSDHLTVTYSCPGFESVSVMFEVGTTNRYVRINGSALVVNSAEHAGIVFHKRVPYAITSGAGIQIDSYTILINGRTANRTDDGFEISNTDFRDGKVKITVSSTNFSSFTEEFTPEELDAASPLNIALNPESKNVILRLDFGDGRVVEETLNIEKNTPEYCQLRAGQFHGFHAHRLMGSTPETYNVDVKPTYVAAAVSGAEEIEVQQTVAAEREEQATNAPIAPVMEKAPTAIWEEKKPERKAPEFVNETQGQKATKQHININFGKVAMVVLTILLAGFVLWQLASIFGSTEEEPAETTKADTVATVKTTIAEPSTPKQETPKANALSADEQADIEYLNGNIKWKKSSIKTEKYTALYDAIVAGDINAVVNNDYFKVEGRATNKKAIQAVDFMWKSTGTYNEKGNVKRMKGFADKDALDLHELVEQLATVQPKEPNTAARPSVKQ